MWHLSRHKWQDLYHDKIDLACTSWISDFLGKLSWFEHITDAQREVLVRASTLVAFSAGETVLESGCAADSIGIVLQSQAFRASHDTQRWLPGECFGLDALAPGRRYRYGVTAEANLLVLMLPQHAVYDLPVATLDTLRHTLQSDFLHELSWFGGLTDMERRAAYQLAESKKYPAGSCICRASQSALDLCVVTTGTVTRSTIRATPHNAAKATSEKGFRSFVCKAVARCLSSEKVGSNVDDIVEKKSRRRSSRTSFIGEPHAPPPRKPNRYSGFWDREPSDEANESLGPGSVIADANVLHGVFTSNVTADSATEVVTLSVAGLELALGPISAVILRARQRIRKVYNRPVWPKPDDLVFGPCIGSGSFGHVQVIHHASLQRCYAMKVADKRTSSSKVAINERNILHTVAHNCLAIMHGSWEDAKHYYILLNFLAGGELYERLSKVGTLDLHATRFYAACITSALVYLHERNIAYRDLKSENIMLDTDGYAVLVDFGLSKVLLGRTYTMCGTPEYLAPEMIDRRGHGTEVDWWALGVLTYEMLIGSTPFACDDELELLNRIVHAKFSFPWWLHGKARDFIGSMLISDPTKRLGDGTLLDERDNVIHHGFFEVDFFSLEQRQIAAPYVPKLVGNDDTRHFDVLDECVDFHPEVTHWQPWSAEKYVASTAQGDPSKCTNSPTGLSNSI